MCAIACARGSAVIPWQRARSPGCACSTSAAAAACWAEPLTRLGAAVLGADAVAENIEAARLHAEQCGFNIDYRCATAEELAENSTPFDAVLIMEVIEHVADREAFLAACGALVKPGGALAFATLNRTIKAYVLAILGAEYVLGWLPRGSHSWDKFVRPAELARSARRRGLVLDHLSGVTYSPLDGAWRLSGDTAVNYMGILVKRAVPGPRADARGGARTNPVVIGSPEAASRPAGEPARPRGRQPYRAAGSETS